MPGRADLEVRNIQTLAVLEERDSIARLLRPMLDREHFRLLRPDAGGTLRCALLLVAPDWRGSVPETSCRILLTPPDKAPLLRRVDAAWVVSFGPGRRESISFSSLEPDGLTLSVRRALPTLSGRMLETQELPLRCAAAAPEEMLAACAAALLAEALPRDARDGA